MRKIVSLTLFLLLAVWAVGQQTTTPPTAPSDHSQAQTQSQSQATPDQGPDSSGMSIVQGCLGGTNPNYTITDKTGTAYQLKVPKGADVSVLSKHIGEPVAVLGVVDNGNATASSGATSGSVAGSENAGGSSRGTHSIRALRIGRGTATCPASGGTAKPQSK